MDRGPGFHVVMGNEACDLDSMVSAVAYAYFLSKVRPLKPRTLPHVLLVEPLRF